MGSVAGRATNHREVVIIVGGGLAHIALFVFRSHEVPPLLFTLLLKLCESSCDASPMANLVEQGSVLLLKDRQSPLFALFSWIRKGLQFL